MAQDVDVSMPSSLDIQEGYSVRVTAVDASGNLVPGVNVATVVLTADDGATVAGGGGGGGTLGSWFLVPGPGA